MHEITKSDLKILYSDILRGHSKINYSSDIFYIKHFNILDISEVENEYQKYFEIAKNRGVYTEEQLAEFYQKTGEWTKNNDKEISTSISFIDRMKETKAKLALEWQITQINKQISDEENKLNKLKEKKRKLFDKSAESYANSKVYNYQMFNALYKTADFKDKPFSFEEFDALPDDSFILLSINYSSKINKFNDKTLKRIAISAFFLNSFCICKDNPINFYGKPVAYLTFYQSELFNYGLQFKHIISELGNNNIGEKEFSDPDLLIERYNKSKSMKETFDKAASKSDSGGVSMIGASKKELQEHGPVIDLVKEARKRGGSLSIQDGLQLFG